MIINKTSATVITILAGIGAILAFICFIIELSGFTGFAALYYISAALFVAVVFAIIGALAIREIKIFVNALKAKKQKELE